MVEVDNDTTNQPEEQQQQHQGAEATTAATAVATPATAEAKILNTTVLHGVQTRVVPRGIQETRGGDTRGGGPGDSGEVDTLTQGMRGLNVGVRACQNRDLAGQFQGLRLDPSRSEDEDSDDDEGTTVRGDHKDKDDLIPRGAPGVPTMSDVYGHQVVQQTQQTTQRSGAVKRTSSQGQDPFSKGYKTQQQTPAAAQPPIHTSGGSVQMAPTGKQGTVKYYLEQKQMLLQQQQQHQQRRQQQQNQFGGTNGPTFQQYLPPGTLADFNDFNIPPVVPPTGSQKVVGPEAPDFGEVDFNLQDILEDILAGEQEQVVPGQGQGGQMSPQGQGGQMPPQGHATSQGQRGQMLPQPGQVPYAAGFQQQPTYMTQPGTFTGIPGTNNLGQMPIQDTFLMQQQQQQRLQQQKTTTAGQQPQTQIPETGSNIAAILRGDRKLSGPRSPDTGYDTGESMVASPASSVMSDLPGAAGSRGSRPSSGEEQDNKNGDEIDLVLDFIEGDLAEMEEKKRLALEEKQKAAMQQAAPNVSAGVPPPPPTSHGSLQQQQPGRMVPPQAQAPKAPGPAVSTTPVVIPAVVPPVAVYPPGVQIIYRFPPPPPATAPAPVKFIGRPPNQRTVIAGKPVRRIEPMPPGGVPQQQQAVPVQRTTTPARRPQGKKADPKKPVPIAPAALKEPPPAPAPAPPAQQPAAQRDDALIKRPLPEILTDPKLKIRAHRLVVGESVETILKKDGDGDTWLHRYILHQPDDNNAIYMINAIIQRLKREHNNRAIDITVEINKQNNVYQTPVYLATYINNQWVLDWLLKAGGDPNIDASSSTPAGPVHRAPLHLAAARGDEYLDVLYVLLECRRTDLNKRNSDGLRPLHVAVESHGKPIPKSDNLVDSTRVILALIQKGANLEEKDERTGKTAIHFLVETQNYDLIRTVFSVIPDTDLKRHLRIQTSAGNTPLHTAAQCAMSNVDKHKQIIKLLLEKGADTTIKNSENSTAGAVIYKPHREELAPLLRASHGKTAAHHSHSNAASPRSPPNNNNPKSPPGGKHILAPSPKGANQILAPNALPVTTIGTNNTVLVYTLPSTVPLGQGVMGTPIMTSIPHMTCGGIVQVTQAPGGFPNSHGGTPIGSPLMAHSPQQMGSPGMVQVTQALGSFPNSHGGTPLGSPLMAVGSPGMPQDTGVGVPGAITTSTVGGPTSPPMSQPNIMYTQNQMY